MLAPGRQYLLYVQVADIDLLVSGTFTVIDTAIQDLEVHVRVGCEEEWQRVPLASRPIPDTMYRRLEPAVGLPLEILADVADERAGLGRRVDPDPILVEHLEGGDGVLEDERQPWESLASHCVPLGVSVLL